MTLYVDASAFIKRYMPAEEHHAECLAIMARDELWTTSAITEVEAARGIVQHAGDEAPAVLDAFDFDLSESGAVHLDAGVIRLARSIATQTGLRTLDAIHVASAQRFPDDAIEFLTYDERQARVAESVGLRLAR